MTRDLSFGVGITSFAMGVVVCVAVACGDVPATDVGTADGGDAGGPGLIDSGVSGPNEGGVYDGGADAARASDFCATFPALPSVRPTAANTGVPPGTTLTPETGMTITVAGTVIDARDVTGTINVEANDVIIMNSKVHVSGGPSDIAIKVKRGITGTKILRSEVYSDEGAYIGIYADNTTVCGSYVHGWENGMPVGGGSMLQANYIDRLQGGQPGAHYDGIEVYGGGAPSKLWGNNIRLTDPKDEWRGETGAINLTAWAGDIDAVEMNGNWLGGGSYTLYVDEQNGDQATNVKVTNNRFYRDSAAYGTHLVRDEASVIVWSGNVFDDNGDSVSK